jgi:glycosyltransferase involved in cell wall biosynthesis
VKVAALPKDPNPYQELLYGPIRDSGTPVAYVGESTRSRTANQLLLPLELMWMRVRGFQVLHIHWLFGFRFAGAERWPSVLRVSRLWFDLVLTLANALGYRMVWTAHNVLPHTPIFDDDLAARRTLVRRCELVIVHTSSTRASLEAHGLTPRRSAVIPPGSYELPQFAALAEPPPPEPTRVLTFGQVAEYKGVEDLLVAVAEVAVNLEVVVAGRCPSSALQHRLEEQAAEAPARVTLMLRFVSDEELAALFESVHAVVLPFRDVTTSSSVLLAMASGRPVVVPDLPAFSDLPSDAVIRYPAGVAGLRGALEMLSRLAPEDLARIGRTGRSLAMSVTWQEIGHRTLRAFSDLLS